MKTGRMLLPLLTLVPAGVIGMIALPDYRDVALGVMLAGQALFIGIALVELRRADQRERAADKDSTER